ncbi:cardiolipin synthase [Rossellomorea vietnamensis]|uniref:Cardiolipin synthase n=1 Tax=Rossellomorea vietnamensis TaxID=218284 RepID=A0A5D4KGD5_9BACI|nr:cardiolipin synthase [Rossellomorea vietnamensis]TYR75323.1 cardiolipin synthase [Rossellomorea vietnamensis]
MWILTIFIILAAIILWCILDFHFGRKAFVRTAYRRDYQKRQSDMELISTGPAFFERLFADIKEATSSIHCLFYIVENDHLGRQFLELLKQKAKEGVEVRLLMDKIGSFKIKKKMVKELQDNGIVVYFAEKPKLPYLFFSTQQRNHRKITVLDGKIGYLGGYNVGKAYIDEDPKLSPWRDYHMRIVGEGTSDLQREFGVDWKRATGEDIINKPAYFPSDLKKGAMEHRFFPSEGFKIESQFVEFISTAKKSIFIGTPYFIPSEEVLDALVKALKRGIKVTIVSPEKPDHPLVKEAAFKHFRKLIPLGAEVYHYQTGFYHSKLIILDDEFCDIGTANFDLRSFYVNLELNNFTYTQSFVDEVRKEVQKDIEGSKKVSLDELNSVSIFTRFKEGLASLVSILL